jgi:hypothetical protein
MLIYKVTLSVEESGFSPRLYRGSDHNSPGAAFAQAVRMAMNRARSSGPDAVRITGAHVDHFAKLFDKAETKLRDRNLAEKMKAVGPITYKVRALRDSGYTDD